MQHITPFLWFDGNAEEAANLYISIFPNSSITHIARNGENGPGPEGSALVVSFNINGQPFAGLNGGPMFKFTEAVSFVINCKDQEEIDHYWNSLTADGGEESMCGWLKDKFGLSWQVVPVKMGELIAGPDPEKSGKVMQALMTMKKIDLPTLEKAYAEG